jgi:hypothetical protein
MRTLLRWWKDRKRAETSQYRWITGSYLTPQEEAEIARRHLPYANQRVADGDI